MEKNKNSNDSINVNQVRPEFRKHNGEMVRIIDMTDDELINAIDFIDSSTTRRERELEKLSKIKSFLVLEYSMRNGSHITTPCAKQGNIVFAW